MSDITSLAHVALKVSDIEASLAFYRDGFQFEEMSRLEKDGRLWLIYLKITDTHFLELFPEANGERAPAFGSNGIDHFCFGVASLQPVVERLLARGLKVSRWIEGESGPELIEAGMDSMAVGADGNKQAWLMDPDGNRIELIEMLPGNMVTAAIERLARA